LIEQNRSTPEVLAKSLLELAQNETVRETMRTALARWDRPLAANQIAESILEAVSGQTTSWSADPETSGLAAEMDVRAEANAPVAITHSAMPVVSASSLAAQPIIHRTGREAAATL